MFFFVNLFQIVTPTGWNLIGPSTTAPSPVIAQQYSSVNLISLCCHYGQEIFGALVKDVKAALVCTALSLRK